MAVGAARVGDAVATGHLCDTTTTIASGATTVLINGRPAARALDPLAPHTSGIPPICLPHSAVVNAGRLDILVEGKPLATFGSSADAGSITSSSENVAVSI
jgi:uncharacterized Zn-binding protein involved in type VI secretion